MIEVITLAVIAFIFAYLYANVPGENQALRVLFLLMCFVNLIALYYVILHPNTKVVYKYNETGAYIGKEVIEISRHPGVEGTLNALFHGNIYVFVFVFAIVLILLFYNLVIKTWRK